MEKNAFTSISIRSAIPSSFFEKKAAQFGLLVCGIDEVGRGPLAGPIVAAAVILKPSRRFPSDLIDSKELSLVRRERMCEWIQNNAWTSVAVISGRRIDDISVGKANYVVMERALASLVMGHRITPACVLVDSVPLVVPWLQQVELPHAVGEYHEDSFIFPWNRILSFYQGETKSRSIAAASIVAKVFRDNLMTELAQIYPRYLFHQHKGYGTVLHYERLREAGCSILHRKSFLSNFINSSMQLSLIGGAEE